MTIIFPETEECSLCSESFIASAVGSFTIIGRYSDFRPICAGVSPLSSIVKFCPSCQIAYFFDGDYIRELDEAKKTSLKESLPDLIGMVRDSFDDDKHPAQSVVFQAILACEVAEKLQLQPQLLGSLWQHAAWILRDRNETGTLYRKCLKNARNAYLKCIESPSLELSYDERELVIYLIGELSRRLGEFKMAVEFLERVARQDLVVKAMELRDLALEGDTSEQKLS